MWPFRRKSTPTGANVGLPSQGYLPTLGAVRSASSVLVSQATAMSVSAVHACVSIRSQDVARCEPRLFKRRKSGTRERVREHDLVELFKKPNSKQTWFEFCEQTMTAYLLRGNGYAAKKGAGSAPRYQVNELIPINPDAVLVLEGADGEIFYNVNRIGLWQIAMLREFPVAIPYDDMFHLRGMSFNALFAASTIGLARDSIGVAMGLEQQAARWMANGSRPSVVLQSARTLTQQAADRLKKSWNDAMAGLQNTGSTAVLENGIEAKPLQLTTEDIEFINQRNFQTTDICRFYRTPPFKLGITELRGINIDQINNEYVNNTVMPDLHRLEQRLDDAFDLDSQDMEVDFDERSLLRADITARFAAARVAMLSGFMSANEIREAEDLPPVEGGDQIFRPLNMAALGSDVTGTAPDNAGKPPQGEAAPGPTPGAGQAINPKGLELDPAGFLNGSGNHAPT